VLSVFGKVRGKNIVACFSGHGVYYIQRLSSITSSQITLTDFLIIRLEARLRSSIEFTLHGNFGRVHVFGYNSAERKPI